MWEISLIIQTKYKKYLMVLEEKLKIEFGENKIQSAFYDSKDNSILSIAIDNPTYKFKKTLKKLIAEIILITEKEEIIMNNIKSPTSEQTSNSVFIKTLVLFDFEEEKREIESLLELSKKIDLHAFFNFRLSKLKNKWFELVNLANRDDSIISNAEVLLEVLVESIAPSGRIIIVKYDKGFEFYDENGDRCKDAFLTKKITDEAELITNLILLSPKKIKLMCKDKLTKESLNLINYIFSNKLI